MWSSTGNAVTYNNWAIGQSFYSSSDANQLTIGRIIPFLWYAEAAADSSGNPVKKFAICEF
jgi:hypothetical protein